MLFDEKELYKSSFRGIEFFTKEDAHSGGQRLTDHSFINGGTLTESNGVENNTIKISGYIGGDDYLKTKQALKEAFEIIEPGILIDRFNGEIEVFVDKWSIKESATSIGMATIDVTFKKSKNKVEKKVKTNFNVDMRSVAIENFRANYSTDFGDEIMNDVASMASSVFEKMEDAVKFLEDVRDESQELKSKIGGAIHSVKRVILETESLIDNIVDIWSSFDEVFDLKLFGDDEQKSFTNSIRDIAVKSDIKETGNYAIDSANRNFIALNNMIVAGILYSSIKNLENITFSTGDDFGSVKDATLECFEILERTTKSRDNIYTLTATQNAVNTYQLARRKFIDFSIEKFSSLQEKKEQLVEQTTNIFSLSINSYKDIKRTEEIMKNNQIVDPLFISGKLEMLDY